MTTAEFVYIKRMMKNKFLTSILIFLISLPIFIWLESGLAIKSFVYLVRPLIFASSLAVFITPHFRKFLLIISLSLLGLMIIFYLFWQIDISNWLGSLGIGLLTIYVIEHISGLIKKGYVEKL